METECPYDLPSAEKSAKLTPLIEKYELALLLLLGFAGFSLLVAFGYNALRRYVFKDIRSLDVVFDAGGRVSLSLTAVTVTSQMLWPADFLQSPTVASKVGVGGSLWYSLAIILSVLMFPVLCIQLKTRAPGAKTFPQIAYARFGKPTHLMFCVVALFTNLVITANLILAGKASIEVFVKDTSDEFIVLILAVLFGSYCLVGGLGTTFYISYFNTAVIFISSSFFILSFTYTAEPHVKEATSVDSIYDALSCLKGPDGNYDETFLTFRTESGLVYAIVTLFMTIAIIFCDQANWQSRIAAKPREGIIGFFIAGFLWFAIPTPISFVNSMTYKAMSFRNGTNILTDAQIDEGYITPFIIQTLLGREGCFMFLTLMSMTLMSTGSGEVMSVASILVYDIIKIYLRPFRPNMAPTDCPLCGKAKVPQSRDTMTSDLCACPSALDCKMCRDDKKMGMTVKLEFDKLYECKYHGKYRHYEDQLFRYKTWCMVCVTISLVPLGLLIIASGMNLNWAFMAAQVFIAPFLVPLYMTIAWDRATSKGLISGSLIGLVAAVTGMFSYATRYDGGLSKFYENTAQDWSILTGLLSGTITSTIIAIVVSLVTGQCQKKRLVRKRLYCVSMVETNLENNQHGKENGTSQENPFAGEENGTSQENPIAGKQNGTSPENPIADKQNGTSPENPIAGKQNGINPENPIADKDDYDLTEWAKTMSIDSPLNPYRHLYTEELKGMNVGRFLTSTHMEKMFRKIRIFSYTGAAISFLVFLIIVPVAALSQKVLTEGQLGAWISVCQHWCLIGTVFVVLVPPIQEGIQIYRQYRSNAK